MFRSLVVLSFLAGVAAFAPSATRSSSRAMSLSMSERSKALPFLMKPAKLDGTLAGDEGFDPLGLSNINDLGVDLYWLREAELKHARVAMLAFVGLIMQEVGFVAPGFPSGSNQISVFWEVVEQKPGPIVAAIVMLGIGELISGFAITAAKATGDRAPGDFGFDPLRLGSTEAKRKEYALKEIRNGRLAMLASAGILFQEATTQGSALSGGL
jgi:hypothetical protein